MRITKEMFESLNKKDRQEFSDKIKNVRDNIPILSLFTTYTFWTIHVFAFSLLVIPLWKIAFGISASAMMSLLFLSLTKIMFVLILIGLVIDFALVLSGKLKMDKIKEEYFQIEVKVKKRKY